MSFRLRLLSYSFGLAAYSRVEIGEEMGRGGRGLGGGVGVGQERESEVGRFMVVVAEERRVKVVVRSLLLVLIGI